MQNFWGRIKEYGNENRPEDIINEQFELINDATDGRVIGRVERYEQGITDLKNDLITDSVRPSLRTMSTPRAISLLGETQEEGSISYEVYLTARVLPKYKYRFMFLQHGVVPYPTDIIIESAIAQELRWGSYEYSCENERDFCTTLQKVLSSERVMTIVSRLNSYK